MSELQSEFDVNNHGVVSSIDDLPLWSAPFGLKLLDVVEMRPGLRALDVAPQRRDSEGQWIAGDGSVDLRGLPQEIDTSAGIRRGYKEFE